MPAFTLGNALSNSLCPSCNCTFKSDSMVLDRVYACPKCGERFRFGTKELKKIPKPISPPPIKVVRDVPINETASVVGLPQGSAVDVNSPFAPNSIVRMPSPQFPRFECPYCHTTIPPVVKFKPSIGGWIMFVIFFFSCACISPLFLFMGQEQYRVCQGCGIKLD